MGRLIQINVTQIYWQLQYFEFWVALYDNYVKYKNISVIFLLMKKWYSIHFDLIFLQQRTLNHQKSVPIGSDCECIFLSMINIILLISCFTSVNPFIVYIDRLRKEIDSGLKVFHTNRTLYSSSISCFLHFHFTGPKK